MPRARRGDRHRSPRPGGALVRLGEVVIGREDAESALEAVELAELAYQSGRLHYAVSQGERRRHERALRARDEGGDDADAC